MRYWYGRSLNGSQFLATKPNVATKEDCMDLCLKNSQCFATNHMPKIESIPGHLPTCYLWGNPKELGDKTMRPNYTSAVKCNLSLFQSIPADGKQPAVVSAPGETFVILQWRSLICNLRLRKTYKIRGSYIMRLNCYILTLT